MSVLVSSLLRHRSLYNLGGIARSLTPIIEMSTNCPSSYNRLMEYRPPEWAKDLTDPPSSYVQLATRHTPIHPWNLPGLPEGVRLEVKRDDMTGSVLSGNKVRKLEFLLGDALEKNCDSIVTCGGIQSNHARATAVASRQLGLQPHLVLRWHGEIDPDAVDCRGNLLLDRAVGARIVLVPPLSYEGGGSSAYGKDMKGLRHKMEDYKKKLESEGHVPYLIPVGGSTTVGTWGYIEAYRELMEQGLHERFDDLVMATGSGGTLCGLAVANYLTGSKLRIHGVCVCDSADYFYQHVDDQLKLFGLTTNREGNPLRARDIVDVIEGYKGRGYGLNTEEELAQLVEVMNATGIILDPVYTLKGVRGMLAELTSNPGRFKGQRILYLHTGGVFGLYDGRVDDLFKKLPTTNSVLSHEQAIPNSE